MLKIDAISRHFGGLQALVEVDLDVAAGAVLGLIGPNGSGKTTLFNVVTGLYPPTAGRISFNGRDISGRPPHDIVRSGIARTFQTPRIFQRMSVLENIRAAQHGLASAGAGRRTRGTTTAMDHRTLIDDLLHATGLADRAGTLARNLPLPDQRRLELARALARSPELLLLDEPAGGMTPAETQEMARLIGEVALPGRTCVIIEHKMDMIARLCDEVCVLNFGRKIAQGRAETVLGDPVVLEAYLGRDEAAHA